MESSQSKPTNVRARGYCFTINNWTEADQAHLEKAECEYLVYGKETGEAGTAHLQGYIYFKNQLGFAGAKSRIGDRAHIERARGSPAENRAYCTKSGDYVERGTCPSKGARNDLHLMRQIIQETSSVRKVIEQVNSLQAVRSAEIMLKYAEPGRTDPPTVHWYHGPTGTGKTKTAFEVARNKEPSEEPWVSHGGLQWFDGYDGHGVVILDDLRPDDCKFNFLLRLLDRYPLRVPVKGGYRSWRPHTIFITSPFSPIEFICGSNEDKQQLTRRITNTKDFLLDQQLAARQDPDMIVSISDSESDLESSDKENSEPVLKKQKLE